MEKEQPDSLATVAVVSEKMQQAHSNYAPSEVYSTAEPPPAYMRPKNSTAVQIARIAAVTLVAMSVILGSFILASSWVQARASCTPESIAAMQAELRLQNQQSSSASLGNYPQPEFLKHLQPEALVQEEAKPVQQSLDVKKEEPVAETKESKNVKEEENSSKSDSDSGDDEDDYDDDEFPPVHIKLPLQFDFDDIAGTLIQEARSRVSCVVERRRADQVMDGPSGNSLDNNNNNSNNTDSRYQRLSGERVAILCESGNPRQEQPEEMLTPIIIPLGTVQVPIQGPEAANPVYHQYQVPDMQQLPLSDPRGLNHIPAAVLPPELRNAPQLAMEMRPPRMGPQMDPQAPAMGPQMEIRRVPIELRHFPVNPVRGMRPPVPQEQVPVMYQHIEQSGNAYGQEQGPVMMPPPPPPAPQPEAQVHEQRMVPILIENQAVPEQRQAPQAQAQPAERPRAPFQGIPFEIRRIIQQVPLEIKNIIQHITGEARPLPVPDGARRENVHEFKPFPEGAQPLGLPLPVEVRNLLEGRQRGDSSEQQEDDAEEERNFPVPAEIRNIIHQVVEGNAFPVPRFPLPLRPVDSLEIPVEARAEVSDGQESSQQQQQQQQQQKEQQEQQSRLMIQRQQQQQQEQEQQSRLMLQRQQQEMQKMQEMQQQQQPQQQEQEEETRPHYVQPRSVRSIPDAFTHRREKRVRRCACDCAC